MEPQLSASGMENTVKSDPGSQAFRIHPELQQGLGGAFKQQIVHNPPVESAQWIEDIRQGENAMMIRDRK